MDDWEETLDFSLPGHEEFSRRAFRACVPGLDVLLSDRRAIFPVRDVSAVGLAFAASPGLFREGDALSLDLLVSGHLFIAALEARTVRITADGVVGCSFVALDRRQEERLDKLVLEVQKRMVALRKAAEAEQDEATIDKKEG